MHRITILVIYNKESEMMVASINSLLHINRSHPVKSLFVDNCVLSVNDYLDDNLESVATL